MFLVTRTVIDELRKCHKIVMNQTISNPQPFMQLIAFTRYCAISLRYLTVGHPYGSSYLVTHMQLHTSY